MIYDTVEITKYDMSDVPHIVNRTDTPPTSETVPVAGPGPTTTEREYRNLRQLADDPIVGLIMDNVGSVLCEVASQDAFGDIARSMYSALDVLPEPSRTAAIVVLLYGVDERDVSRDLRMQPSEVGDACKEGASSIAQLLLRPRIRSN